MSMYTFKPRRKNLPVKRKGSQGFPDGLNTLAHESTLKETELSELINGIYSQYGSISKRQGTKVIGSASSGGTKIMNMYPSYKIGDVDRFIRMSDSGKPEVYSFTTGLWSDLSATAPVGYVGTSPSFSGGVPTFDTTYKTNIVQAQGKLFFANPVDQLTWLDADGWHVFTALDNPVTKASLAKTGTGTGTTTYYYTYVNYNEVGGTEAAPEGVVGVDPSGTGYLQSMPRYLDTSTYITVTIPAAPTGCTRRAIFRGTIGGALYYLTDLSPSETTYVDKGTINPSERYLTPETGSNDTGGQHFYLLEAYEDSLVGVSKEYGRDVVSFSAGLDKLMSFNLPDGGGYYPYKQGDGTYINALKSFSASNTNSLFVFKDKLIGKFQFTTAGDATIQDINVSVGTRAQLSPHAAGNNLRFWSDEGAASLGNEANFGTILRYSVLSLKADEIVKSVTPANIPSVCGTFFNHLSIFGISTDVAGTSNNSALVFDERYNAWSLWTGIYPNVFCTFINPVTKEEKLYYGSSKDANVLEMFSGKTDYATSTGTGSKITLSLTTKQYDMGLPDRFKRYDKATIVFGTLFGNNTTVGVIKADEQDGVTNDPRLRISSDPTLSGFGGDEWGNQEFGMMTADSGGTTIPVRYVNLQQKDLFWVKLNIQNDGIEDEVSIIGIYIYYSDSNKPLPFSTQLQTLA